MMPMRTSPSKNQGGGTAIPRREFLFKCGGGLLGAASASGVATLAQPARQEYRGGMTYRPLGRTGLGVSLLAFGSHTDPADRVRVRAGKTALTQAGQARRDRIIEQAFDMGVNLLDVYDSEGQWEPAARLVKSKREQVLISLMVEPYQSGVTTVKGKSVMSLAYSPAPEEIDRACRLFGHIDLCRFHTADVDEGTLQTWDVLRRAKAAGKVRAIGIATHIERTMLAALKELEGIDYLFFPYNFIHARGDYSQFLPEAIRQEVGLIAMKPLASGSIVKLDPRVQMQTGPEFQNIELWQHSNKPVLPAVVAELTKSLDRLPDETLCMAAMRFVYARPFVATAITGMFEERCLKDNHRALAGYEKLRQEETAALKAASHYASSLGASWLPSEYRWLEEEWRA
jgi:aryl-alcohol dehydrogenase-like predicted oxidoreductase